MNPFCNKCKILMISKLKTRTDKGQDRFTTHFLAYKIWKCPQCKKEIRR